MLKEVECHSLWLPCRRPADQDPPKARMFDTILPAEKNPPLPHPTWCVDGYGSEPQAPPHALHTQTPPWHYGNCGLNRPVKGIEEDPHPVAPPIPNPPGRRPPLPPFGKRHPLSRRTQMAFL
ncbi:uncharacterized [Tachysurus ichikawai]